MEEINRDCVLEYELDAEVLHLEETPELVENVWDPKEKGQQGQAETIYDPEAGVTATLRDISNVGANLIIRREDDDDGAEVIYGEAYILQRQVDGEWQDAETVPDNYGFPLGVALRSTGTGRISNGLGCLKKRQRFGKRTDIPGAYTFSTLERGKANEEKSIMDNRGMYHTNQYMGYQGNLFVQQSRSNHHI